MATKEPKNGHEIFKNVELVMNGDLKTNIKFWCTTLSEEYGINAANCFIFDRLYKLTKKKKFKELLEEYTKRNKTLSELNEFLREFLED